MLGINIDESGFDFPLCRAYGYVNRNRGFSAAALLGDNRECFHQPPPPLHPLNNHIAGRDGNFEPVKGQSSEMREG